MKANLKLLMAALPIVCLYHSAMAQEPAKVKNADQQKVARNIHNISLTESSSMEQHQQPAAKAQQPVDNDHDPHFQKLKIHDPNYTAAMSFE